jgi:ribonuclease HII
MTNVGYATEEHRAAILSLGPTRHHRMTFAPLQLSLAFDANLIDQVPLTP